MNRVVVWLACSSAVLSGMSPARGDAPAKPSPAQRESTCACPAQAEEPRGETAAGAIVYVNEASSEELQTLPGVGPARAERIIATRASRKFRRPSDLMRVSGIGRKTFANFRDLVSTNPRPLSPAGGSP